MVVIKMIGTNENENIPEKLAYDNMAEQWKTKMCNIINDYDHCSPLNRNIKYQTEKNLVEYIDQSFDENNIKVMNIEKKQIREQKILLNGGRPHNKTIRKFVKYDPKNDIRYTRCIRI